MGVGMAVACAGLAGCGGDDDDGPEAGATTVVVTNVVSGVSATNVVVVTNAAAILNVAGKWSGTLTGAVSGSQISLDLDLLQDGSALAGRYSRQGDLGSDSGTATGSLVGEHLALLLDPAGRMVFKTVLTGDVNASATRYSGTFDTGRESGTFSLRKSGS